jgi:hypothetical protein
VASESAACHPSECTAPAVAWCGNPPRARSLGVRAVDAEAVSEVDEERGWMAPGEDVRELPGAGDVQDAQLDVLRALVMNWVPAHVPSGDIVTQHDRGLVDLEV